MPSVYRSGTLILVEQPTVPTEMVATNAISDLQDRLDSIEQQIRSRTRLLRVIDQLNLYAKERARHMSDDTLVGKIEQDSQIELVRSPGKEDLTAFNIYFSADNPYVAQQVTNELTEHPDQREPRGRPAERQKHQQLPGQPAGRSAQSLAEQEEKVREFKDRYLGELPGQLRSNLQILSGLQNQLQAEQDALGRAKQQNVYLRVADQPVQDHGGRTAKPGEPAAVGLPALDQELDRLKAQLADLSSRYTDQHPDVRKVKEQIAQTEKMRSSNCMAEMKAKARRRTRPNSTRRRLRRQRSRAR